MPPLRLAVVATLLLACGAPARPDRAPATREDRAAAAEERERLDAVIAAESLKRFSADGSHEELARSLSGIAANPTSAGRTAKAILGMLRAPPAFDPKPTVPLGAIVDALLKRQIDALVYERCVPRDDGAPNAIVASLIGFGYTALDALETAKSDRRLSRCVGVSSDDSICSIDPSACPTGPGPALPSVRTVGSLAAFALQAIVPSGEALDRSDLECNDRGGGDQTIDGLVEHALREREHAQAVALTRRSLGRMRLRLVTMIATTRSPSDETKAFLVEEATNGPVLAARMRAAHALRDARDIRWPPLAAKTIDAALRGDDVIRERERCDRSMVESELRTMLEKFPKEMLTAMSSGFASYAVRRKVDAIDAVLSTPTPLTAEGAALAAKALRDTRGIRRTWRTNDRVCEDPSPSDMAALHLAPRLGIPYACTMTAEEKARAVEAILAKRGKVVGW